MKTVEFYLRILRSFLHFFIIGDIHRINLKKGETDEKREERSREEKREPKGEWRIEKREGRGEKEKIVQSLQVHNL